MPISHMCDIGRKYRPGYPATGHHDGTEPEHRPVHAAGGNNAVHLKHHSAGVHHQCHAGACAVLSGHLDGAWAVQLRSRFYLALAWVRRAAPVQTAVRPSPAEEKRSEEHTSELQS